MKKLLLTGFEPFLNFKTNPTASVVKALDGKVIGNFKVIGKVYPVVFNEIKSYIQNDINQTVPDIVISLGLAGGIHTIDLERIAINCIDGKADNAGFQPDGEKIEKDGPDGIFSTLPLKRIEANLMEFQIPVRITNTAGTYLCNNVMYSGLYHLQEKEMKIPAGFIHVPQNHEIGSANGQPSWSQEDIIKAIEQVIRIL